MYEITEKTHSLIFELVTDFYDHEIDKALANNNILTATELIHEKDMVLEEIYNIPIEKQKRIAT